MHTFFFVFLFILSFLGIITLTAFVTFFCTFLYIQWKRRVKKKYHYNKPASEYQFTIDAELADNQESGSKIDGSSALQNYKR